MNLRGTSGRSQNASRITKSLGLDRSKSRSPFFRSLLERQIGVSRVYATFVVVVAHIHGTGWGLRLVHPLRDWKKA